MKWPLLFLFLLVGCVDGVVFYEGAEEGLLVCRDPWDCFISPRAPANVTPAETQPLIFFYEGAEEGLLVCRDPWTCGAPSVDVVVCPFSVNISWPLDGSVYYFPDINPELNYTVVGSVSPFCEYRLNSGGWNNESCADGLNSFGVATMPEGEPVLVTVRVSDLGCVSSDSISLTVIYGKPLGGALTSGQSFALIVGVLALGALLVLDDKRRRRRRY